MSTEITVRDMEGLWKTAQHVAKSTFAPKDFRNKPDEVCAALLTGLELGLGPMASMRHISLIEGKPSLSAAMQLALLRRAGHRIEVVEQSPTRCAIVGTLPDGTKLEVEYTIEEAKHAGLTGRSDKPNWTKYPADMLWARCVSRYARRADAGATLGIYSPADWDQRDTVTLAPEEYAAVVTKPPEPLEAGELPLKPEDGEVPKPQEIVMTAEGIIVSCPKCKDKVGTQELREHMDAAHGEGA